MIGRLIKPASPTRIPAPEPGPDRNRRLRPDLRRDRGGKPDDLAARGHPPGLVRGPTYLLSVMLSSVDR